MLRVQAHIPHANFLLSQASIALFANQSGTCLLDSSALHCDRKYKLQVFKFINEAAPNNSGVSYWTSASARESCNKLFLSDSLWLLKINANLSLPAGVPNDLCREQGQASAHLPSLYLLYLYLLWL